MPSSRPHQAAAISWPKAWAPHAANLTTVSASAHGSVRAGPVGTFRNCGSSADHAKNLVISIVPDSPKAGQLVTTTFEYDLDKEVTGGSASYGFSFNGIPFSPTVDDLCADQAGGCCPDPCPLAVGHHINKSESDFPSVSGKIVTTIKWSDQDDEQILCVVSSHPRPRCPALPHACRWQRPPLTI